MAAVILSLGGDPSPMIEERDPVLVGLWAEAAERAVKYALARDRRQAIDIALMLAGKPPQKLEV